MQYEKMEIIYRLPTIKEVCQVGLGKWGKSAIPGKTTGLALFFVKFPIVSVVTTDIRTNNEVVKDSEDAWKPLAV